MSFRFPVIERITAAPRLCLVRDGKMMIEAGVIGIARVVVHTQEHLAALVPTGAAPVLNTIHWASGHRSSSAT